MFSSEKDGICHWRNKLASNWKAKPHQDRIIRIPNLEQNFHPQTMGLLWQVDSLVLDWDQFDNTGKQYKVQVIVNLVFLNSFILKGRISGHMIICQIPIPNRVAVEQGNKRATIEARRSYAVVIHKCPLKKTFTIGKSHVN